MRWERASLITDAMAGVTLQSCIILPFLMLRPNVRLDEMIQMNHLSFVLCPNPVSYGDGGEA